jgi:hypothetical protein
MSPSLAGEQSKADFIEKVLAHSQPAMVVGCSFGQSLLNFKF